MTSEENKEAHAKAWAAKKTTFSNMRYYYCVFLWQDGKKAVDYSKYCTAPIFIEDHLDEELDSGQITLDPMPVDTRSAFSPKTKFRIERYTQKGSINDNLDYVDSTGTILTPQQKWDFIVDKDEVEEHPQCPEICTHRIQLIEPSAITQGMHVDNIALTYELQDVDLNYKTINEDGATVYDKNQWESHNGGYY